MAHLVGINKGPVLDWTDDNGIMERYWIWKKRVEILFRGPLNTAGDGVKCNCLIYWAGKMGMDLEDKWETEGKLTDVNRNNIDQYFELFEEHISLKSNALIAIVELKRLFQGTLSLEDFHTKALRLVKEAKYPKGDIHNRVLWDTIISGLASDKIHAKVIKEGEDVTLARVMEIARLEVSTQWHLDRMEETAKVNYVKYRRGSRLKGDPNQNTVAAMAAAMAANLRLATPAKPQNQPWKAENRSYPTTSVGELGDPVYAQTHMVSVNQAVKKKHLIQFPISVDLQKVRKPAKTPCPTVLLKANTGADVNLLNSSTFDKAIGDRSILQPSSLRMEAYGSSTVSILGKFHAFLRWKNRVYKQLFYITSANASPNLLSRDSCYTLGSAKTLLLCWNLKEIQHPDSGASWKAATMYDQWWKWQGVAANFQETFNLKGPTQRSTTEKRGYSHNLYRRIHWNWEISWPSI